MTNRDLEEKLAGAVRRAAPDDLEDVLSRCSTEKGNVIPMTEQVRTSNKSRWLRPALAACLAILLLAGIGGGGLWYQANRAVAATISLDVNPSIELTVNRSERVLTCKALNPDAESILSEMGGGKDLEGSKLDVAVNAIVGALVRHGYLDRISSAILISVEDKDADRGARLQQELVAAVDGVLQSASSQAGVLSQIITESPNLSSQADANHISTGKAALVNQVIAINSGLTFESLAQLSVEELRDLISIGAPGMPVGKDAALAAALDRAGITAADLTYQEVDTELDDETPNYTVTIAHTGGSGEYIVHAFTGEILWASSNGSTQQPSYPATSTDIGMDAAKAAALQRANLTEEAVTWQKAIQDWDDGIVVYDLEFLSGSTLYEATVDARDGAILDWDTEGVSVPSTPAQDVGLDAAKAAALTRAGLTEAQVSWLKTEADWDDGRKQYDLEFVSGSTEYEVKVSAETGAVLKYETEPIRTAAPTAQPTVQPTAQPTTQPTAAPRPTATPKPAAAPTPAPTTAPADIGVEAAKAAALQKAGLTDSQVTWVKAEQDRDNGKLEYELEFIANNTEYDITVLAADGSILKYETEAVRTSTAPATTQSPAASTDIGVEAAKAAALQKAGLTDSQVTWTKAQQDLDNGKLEYELEFIANNTEYDITVLAADGSILKYETEPVRTSTAPATTQSPANSTDIGVEAAKAAALKKAGLTDSQVTWIKAQQDRDNGKLEYELEFIANNTEYDITVLAADGSILKYETEAVRTNTAPATTQSPAASAGIGLDAAKAAALQKAGLTDSQVTWIKTESDWDHNCAGYDIEFCHNGTEYDIWVTAADGSIYKCETEVCDDLNHGHSSAHHEDDHHASNSTADIGLAAAKSAALARAGCTESQITWIKAESDWDHNCAGYDIEFCHDGTEYDIWVTAADGSIYKCETEVCDDLNHGHSSAHHEDDHHASNSTADIGLAAAKSAALARAGCTESQITWIKAESDWDHNCAGYDIEFCHDGTEYDIWVTAADGSIYKCETEVCDDLNHGHSTSHHEEGHHTDSHHSSSSTGTGDIGQDAATAAALAHAGLSQSQVSGFKVERDMDDGRLEYEIEFRCNGFQYEYVIDGTTGAILDHEVDD